MSYPINYPTPQGANFQAFYGGGSSNVAPRCWVKPQGVSMVRMLLIGGGAGGRAGSTGGGGGGGGSGAVTQWIGPAMFIPDILQIAVGAGGASASAGGNTNIFATGKGSGYTLLTASGAPTGTGGTASNNNYFGASGIFKSIAGQTGAGQGSSITASTTTFLSGGSGGASTDANAGGNVATKYGYPALSGGAGTTGGVGQDGYFMFQPILIGQGGAGGGGNTTSAGGTGGNGGIGCGGGGGGRCSSGTSNGGRGGDGAVFIWSW